MAEQAPSEEALRRTLAEYSHAIYNAKLATGPGGTVSARLPQQEVIFVKPSGFTLNEVRPEDFVGVNIRTLEVVKGNLKPSMETAFMAECHRTRGDVDAVAHAHPAFSVTLSSLDLDINTPLYPDHVVFLDKVATLPFYLPGSAELASAVGEAAKGHNCLLLKNHGVITLGSSMREAYYRLEILEESARMIFYASLMGKPTVLSTADSTAIKQLQSEVYRRTIAKRW